MSKERIAALPVRKRKNRADEICLVTSRQHGYWMIPMGKKEKKLSGSDVARLEAYEEAGVLGPLSKRRCFTVKTRSGRKKKQRSIVIYPMKVRNVLKRWPEKKERERFWVPVSQLKKYLTDKTLAKAIHKQLI